jgi:hypothetical protein
MAARKATANDLKRIEELAKRWGKIIVREHWGDQGPGLDVDLTQMEDLGLAAVRGLLAGTLETATQMQAGRLGEQQACPICGRMCPLRPEERPVVVHGGSSFQHCEPKGHCPACRRDFFPSASGVEAGHARLQPVGAEEDRPGGGAGEITSGGRQGAGHGG